MKNTHVVGKTVRINRPAFLLYESFSDLRNFINRLPEDKKAGIEASQDTISGTVKGIKMGVKIVERIPFSRIIISDFSADGSASLFPFEVNLFFDAIDDSTTEFHAELDAELSFMFKVMIGGKLQEAIDKISEQIAMAAEGKINPADFSF